MYDSASQIEQPEDSTDVPFLINRFICTYYHEQKFSATLIIRDGSYN